MLDIGVTKLAIIGGIALVASGPEKMPGPVPTIGPLLGRAPRFVAEVKSEVSRSMELDELKKMKDSMESAARDVESTIQTSASDFEKTWATATDTAAQASTEAVSLSVPAYRHPKKQWRVKQGATPRWYKVRSGVRTHVQSGAARVARFRPQKWNR